jgi:hypothetical protein
VVGQRLGVLCRRRWRGVGSNYVRDIVVVTARAVAMMVLAVVVLRGDGSELRVKVRTKVVSREPKSGVCLAEQCD